MIGRVDIEGSKCNIALNANLQQASYPYGNFSNTKKMNFTYIKDLEAIVS